MKALSHLQDTLWGLVAQGEHYVLMLRCGDGDVPLVHKVIEAVDQNSPGDVFLSFSQPVLSRLPRQDIAKIWIDSVMESLVVQIEGANVLRSQDGSAPWGTLPRRCWEGTASERLNAAIEHIGSLFPAEDDHRVLWAFVPTHIGDPVVWAQIVGGFIERDAPKAGHRIVVRVDARIVDAVRADPDRSALLLDVDFSPEAMANDLVQTALDPTLPPVTRASAVLQLAGLDYAHRRFAESARKFTWVFDVLEDVEETEGTRATCLYAVGEIARQANEFELAKKRYQQALALAAPQPGTLPIAMSAASSLGDLCIVQARTQELHGFELLAEARGYYEIASLIASKLCNVHVKADVLEKLGVVDHELGDFGRAVERWQEAHALCVDVGYELRLEAVRERLAERGGTG